MKELDFEERVKDWLKNDKVDKSKNYPTHPFFWEAINIVSPLVESMKENPKAFSSYIADRIDISDKYKEGLSDPKRSISYAGMLASEPALRHYYPPYVDLKAFEASRGMTGDTSNVLYALTLAFLMSLNSRELTEEGE